MTRVHGDFAIRDIFATRGQRVQGFVDIGEAPARPIRMPLVIVNGAREGPSLCLTAGVHATEYPPIEAVMRTLRDLDPAQLRGTVIATPVVNMAMFESRTPFVSPIDGLNLNTIAPGRRDGTMSEILADVLLNEVIGAAQYYIDLHGGDFGEALLPFVAGVVTGNVDRDRRAEVLAHLYSPDVVVMSDGRTVFPFAGSIVHAAAHRGVVSLIAEAGGDGTMKEDDVQVHLRGIENVLRYLDMIDGEPRVLGARRRGIFQFVIRATRSGLVRLKTDLGDRIAEGQPVAEICNVFGETLEVVRSQASGTAGLIWTDKVVYTGDPLVRCWVTEPSASLSELERYRS